MNIDRTFKSTVLVAIAKRARVLKLETRETFVLGDLLTPIRQHY